MDGDAVRISPMYVGEDEDEVHIDSEKNIELEMESENVAVTNRQPVWIPDGKISRLRLMLNMP